MSDNERRGLGKVVYGDGTDQGEDETARANDENGPLDEIGQASEESFPGSDPPGYTKGGTSQVSIEPGSQADEEA